MSKEALLSVCRRWDRDDMVTYFAQSSQDWKKDHSQTLIWPVYVFGITLVPLCCFPEISRPKIVCMCTRGTVPKYDCRCKSTLVHSFNIATTVEPAADAAAKSGGKGKLLEGKPLPPENGRYLTRKVSQGAN